MGSIATGLTERQLISMKEVVKFLGYLVRRPDTFSTEVKCDFTKVASSNTEGVTELGSVRDLIAYINESFELFRTDVQAFCKEIHVVKTESAQCRKESEELRWDLIEASREAVELKQYDRNINIEIQGLLAIEKESLEQTVANIVKCLGANVTENDIDVAHRVFSKDRKKNCDRSAPHWNGVIQNIYSG
ncbi:hypothetical protein MRX96_018102 [Rhipicephalus microplus]